MNFAAITRRIRRCESEVPAQLVLEYAIAQAVAAEREECAKYVELVRDDWVKADANTKACAADYLAHAIRTRPNALGQEPCAAVCARSPALMC